MRFKTPEEKFSYHFHEAMAICASEGWGDPTAPGRTREIVMANELGHRVGPTLSGPDAYNQTGNALEYKSTTGKSIAGTYNGISVQRSWPEQESYLRNKKLGCYSEHYISRFIRETGQIDETWMLTGDTVCDILVPKLEKKFDTILSKKDPRLGASLTKTEIHKYGKRIK